MIFSFAIEEQACRGFDLATEHTETLVLANAGNREALFDALLVSCSL